MAPDRVINKITEKNKTTFFFFINATPTKYSMIDIHLILNYIGLIVNDNDLPMEEQLITQT